MDQRLRCKTHNFITTRRKHGQHFKYGHRLREFFGSSKRKKAGKEEEEEEWLERERRSAGADSTRGGSGVVSVTKI